MIKVPIKFGNKDQTFAVFKKTDILFYSIFYSIFSIVFVLATHTRLSNLSNLYSATSLPSDPPQKCFIYRTRRLKKPFFGDSSSGLLVKLWKPKKLGENQLQKRELKEKRVKKKIIKVKLKR
jgi:hypothetical protein